MKPAVATVTSPRTSNPLKVFTKTTSPPRRVVEEASEEEEELLPLPDVVLCSALSASILHGQRIEARVRRRHKAAIQTRGQEHLEQDAEKLMAPLVASLEGLLVDTNISMDPDPSTEEADAGCTFHKRRRTISTSSTATAAKLTTISSVTLTSNKLKKEALTIEDTPEGVFIGLKNLFKNVFAN